MPRHPHFVRVAYATVLGLCAVAPFLAAAQVPDGSYAQLHAFTATEADVSMGRLLILPDGRLVGTSAYGGEPGYGTVFELKPGTDTVKVLHTFEGPPKDGRSPHSGMVVGPGGNLWGVTEWGGEYDEGTIFTIDSGGRSRIVHSFGKHPHDGREPRGELLLASDGLLYGSTLLGGPSDHGSIFRINADGCVTTLWGFLRGGPFEPDGPLIQASDGRLYGTSGSGGTYGCGTVFSLAPDGSDRRIVHSFLFYLDGCAMDAGLVEASDGLLYGTAPIGGEFDAGTVFRLDRDGGQFAVLHSFADPGGVIVNGLVEARPGVFFGTTFSGGKRSEGTIFQLLATGELEFVYAFSGSMKPGGWVDGARPSAPLTPVGDGALIGTTMEGGPEGVGTVFKLRAR